MRPAAHGLEGCPCGRPGCGYGLAPLSRAHNVSRAPHLGYHGRGRRQFLFLPGSLPNGEIVLSHRVASSHIGVPTAKYPRGGYHMIQRSSDNGLTWSEPVSAFNIEWPVGSWNLHLKKKRRYPRLLHHLSQLASRQLLQTSSGLSKHHPDVLAGHFEGRRASLGSGDAAGGSHDGGQVRRLVSVHQLRRDAQRQVSVSGVSVYTKGLGEVPRY